MLRRAGIVLLHHKGKEEDPSKKDSRMRIVVVRHGQDEHGYRGGWSQRGLTEEGKMQSQLLAKHLSNSWQPLKFLISSDLRRARETAEYISQEMELPIHSSPLWREMNNGELAGMPNSLAEQLYPGLFASSLEMDEPYPHGESPRQFFQRITHAFEGLCEKMITLQISSEIIVVTHGGVITILSYFLNGSVWSNKEPAIPTNAASIHEISYQEGKWLFTTQNHIDHLSIKG